MTITVIYKTEVKVPEKVWRRYHDDGDYRQAVAAATRGAGASGSEFYADAYEYAEDCDRELIEQIERDLVAVMQRFEQKLEWETP